MDLQKIYETLIQTIKGMFPHYPLPKIPFSAIKIPVTFTEEEGVLFLITVIGIFIVFNKRVRTPLFDLWLKTVEKVKEIF